MTKRGAKTRRYGVSSLEVLSGLDPVRRRPAMFTDTSNPNHLACEVLDNSVDEALAGHCSEIAVTLHEDGGLSVADNGRGMPTGKHKETGLCGVELILTRLHAGAKFSRSQYRFSGGLHGVGVSVVNALASELEVRVRRNGRESMMRFANGERKCALRTINKVPRDDTGTWLKFTPDPQYFADARFQLRSLAATLRTKAILCPGLKVSFHNEATGDKQKWEYNDGLPEYLGERLSGDGALPSSPLRFDSSESQERNLECVVQWVAGESFCESYVNLVPTPRHGTHVNGLRSGLTAALKEYCEFHKLLPKGVTIGNTDVRDGLSFVLSVKMAEPQFAGQTKESLSSTDIAPFIADVVKNRLALWLNRHSEEGRQIAEKVVAAAQRRLKTSKKTPRKTPTAGPALPGKLADCSSTHAPDCELFLVEGDSAGGSARQARDRKTQAILPLRGKIMNTWEVDPAALLKSQEVHDISVALGIEAGDEDLSRLRYHSVCILADADSDGLHIATLICALFVRHFPALIASGHVYVVMPPLYRLDVGKETHYALSDDELATLRKRFAKRKVSVTRFKGLGEMSAKQLRETAMAPETRRLVKLNVPPEYESQTRETLDMLLAKKRAADRREWLGERGNLAGDV